MPTSTFYNLPEEKREKLTAAIKRELARVPFSEVSINRIVQDAGIPRGSYYQYFTDKDDLYRFVIADYAAFMEGWAKQALADSHGDVFSAVERWFDAAVAFSQKQENLTVLANVFAEVGLRQLSEVGLPRTTKTKCPFHWEPYLCLIDTNRLLCTNPEELQDILEILISLARFSTFELFANPSREAEIRHKLQNKLQILKRGMERRPEERL